MTERKSAEERTADLLAAAERILERSRRITVSAITSEAGIASGTFYLYFPSKTHLEATLIERFIDGYVEQARTTIAGPEPLSTRLERTVEGIIEYALGREALLRLQVAHAPTEATRQVMIRGRDHLKTILAEALATAPEEGLAPISDTEMTAALLFHGVEGILQDAVAADGAVDRERLVRAARQHARLLVETPSPGRAQLA